MSERDREAVTGGMPWSGTYTFVPAVRIGHLLFLSGTTATDDRGQIVGRGDIVEQTRHVFRKFERILQSVGATCDDIVETTDYFVTTENYRKTADVRREFFKKNYPASTGVQVAALLREGALIEIKAVAVLPA